MDRSPHVYCIVTLFSARCTRRPVLCSHCVKRIAQVGACFWGLPLPENDKSYDLEPGGSLEIILDNAAINGTDREMSKRVLILLA